MNQLASYDLASNDAIYTSIGCRLRYYRNLRGMNQDELAKASGVSRSTISKIECHRDNMPYSISAFIKLARALHVPLKNLLTDKILT